MVKSRAELAQETISIKIDQEDYDRLFDLRSTKNPSVRLVLKSVLKENVKLKEQVNTLMRENTQLKVQAGVVQPA